MSKKVFFTRKWPGPASDFLSQNGFDVEVWPAFDRPPESEVSTRISDGCYALVTTVEDPIPVSIVPEAHSLEIVAQAGVGFDNLDTKGLGAAGIWTTNTPGVLDDATADLAFALMCSLARRIPDADQYVRSGQWSSWHPSLFLGKELGGATIGIVGLGRIGLAFARRCTGFDMRILYTSRSEKEGAGDVGAEYCTLEQLLEESEIVSLHVPLNAHTRRLISREQLALMRNDAILINTARGGVVDQEALADALRNGVIQGAALDVTDPEPLPADDPLLGAPNLLVVPHIGSAGRQTRERMAMMAAENIVALARGDRPPNALVNLS